MTWQRHSRNEPAEDVRGERWDARRGEVWLISARISNARQSRARPIVAISVKSRVCGRPKRWHCARQQTNGETRCNAFVSAWQHFSLRRALLVSRRQRARLRIRYAWLAARQTRFSATIRAYNNVGLPRLA